MRNEIFIEQEHKSNLEKELFFVYKEIERETIKKMEYIERNREFINSFFIISIVCAEFSNSLGLNMKPETVEIDITKEDDEHCKVRREGENFLSLCFV